MKSRTKADKGDNAVVPSLATTLLELYGPLMSGKALQGVLGFRSADSLRLAAIRGRIGVRTFKIAGRPGRFAVTLEVADFLEQQQRTSSVAALTPMSKWRRCSRTPSF